MREPGQTLIVDVDGTLAGPAPEQGYAECQPIDRVVDRLRAARQSGWRIVLYSARGMRTYSGNVADIDEHVRPELVKWLDRHAIPYDELHLGKLWPGPVGYYVDDRAVRPSEFVSMSDEELEALTARETDPAAWDAL